MRSPRGLPPLAIRPPHLAHASYRRLARRALEVRDPSFLQKLGWSYVRPHSRIKGPRVKGTLLIGRNTLPTGNPSSLAILRPESPCAFSRARSPRCASSVAKNGHWRAPVPQEEGCDKSRRTLKLYELAPLAISCRSMASSRACARPRVRRDSRALRTFSTRVCADAALIASGRAFSMAVRRLQSP